MSSTEMSSNEPPATKKRYTEAQFASAVGFHEKTIAKWRRAGLIQHRGAGRRVWYLEEDVTHFDEHFKHEPTKKAS